MTMQCSRVADEVLAADKMDVLYGEADAEVQERVSAHLGECPACREEMAGLAEVRRRLGAWTLDERGVPARGGPRRARSSWLLAAAVAVLAVGLGVALRGQATLRQQLQAQREQMLERERARRLEIEALHAETLLSPGTDERALLARIDERLEARIRRSEESQNRRLEAGLAEWSARTEAQRRVDMARVAAGLSYLDGRHGQQLARTNELMGYVLENAAEKGAPR
jgi:hypothetical protein